MIQVIVGYAGRDPLIDGVLINIAPSFGAMFVETTFQDGVTDLEFLVRDTDNLSAEVMADGFIQACNQLPGVDASIEETDVY